jgi:hypothetical protein
MKESSFLAPFISTRSQLSRRRHRQIIPCSSFDPSISQQCVGRQLSLPAALSVSTIDVLSTEDLLVGGVLAFGLAFTFSYLQSRRAQSDFVLWEKQADSTFGANATQAENIGVVFDAKSWKEMSRPENYILFKNKLRDSQKLNASSASDNSSFGTEKVWILLALLVLFIPIFSIEFFFALSRQLICDGDPLVQTDWAFELCTPHLNS